MLVSRSSFRFMDLVKSFTNLSTTRGGNSITVSSIDCRVDFTAEIDIFDMKDEITGRKFLIIDSFQSNGVSDSVSFINCSFRKELYSNIILFAGIKSDFDNCANTFRNEKNGIKSLKYTREDFFGAVPTGLEI